ncbi:MAG: hypothetical protein IJC02_07295 [Lachnospiraceae bacterium]|nr:hypothetical protein [Lachnospiraceae bacterium]
MNRKIFYVDCYCEGEKERNIGFVKVEEEGLFVMLRGIALQGEKICKIYVGTEKSNKKFVANITLQNGYGQAKRNWSKDFRQEDCREIYIPIDQKRYGRCMIEQHVTHNAGLEQKKIQPFPKDKVNISKNIQEKMVEQNRIITLETEKKPKVELGQIQDAMPIMEPDKWKQLCKNYPQVHIYPEADTVVIKPKDIIVLTQEYHELATNSFVLHAYYNYRQLLLLRYHHENGVCYYLGVPGVYYEREKKIANMFGFEGFENGESRLVNESRRQVYVGCFGYYMKQVNI